MDKDWLDDYHQRELQSARNFIDWVKNPTKTQNPILKRFSKIKHPISRSLHSSSSGSLWSQIPFSGVTICGLPACPEYEFESYLPFNSNQFDQIIDFVKTTGRLQFVLEDMPENYANFDYLEPLLVALNPPISSGYPLIITEQVDDVKESFTTFDTLAQLKLTSYVYHNMTHNYQSKILHHRLKYATLDFLGDEEIMDDLNLLMISDPEEYVNKISLYDALIIQSISNSYCDSINHSYEQLKNNYLDESINHVNKEYPKDIGRFLISKLTYYPESFDSCKEVIARYDDEDLLSILSTLNKVIRDENFDGMENKITDLDSLLENIWKDRSYESSVVGLNYAIPILLSVIGMVSLEPIADFPGLLSRLGYVIGSQLLRKDFISLSRRMASVFHRNYQINIFDFKTKYRLT